MKKGKARSIIMLSKTDNTVTSLNNLTDDITILSNDNANIQVTTEGQAIKIDSSQVSANKADIATNKTDIATNFNKYLEGYDDDGNFDKSIDCNKSINNGTWYCPNTSTLNIPAECVDINASGYLEVTRATKMSLRQIFTPYGDSYYKKNLFWIRTAHDLTKKFADDTFEPWVKFGAFDQYLAGLGTNGRTSKNNDCNNAVVNGRWFSEGTPNDPNAPTTANGILEIYRATTSSVYQKYTPYSSGNTSINLFYQRSGTDASTKVVWSEWIKFSTNINGLRVGMLIWNDADLSNMPSNCMPAFGSFWMSKELYPEVYEAYSNQIKEETDDTFLRVAPSGNYPYLRVVDATGGWDIGEYKSGELKEHCHDIFLQSSPETGIAGYTPIDTDSTVIGHYFKNAKKSTAVDDITYIANAGSDANGFPSSKSVYCYLVASSVIDSDLEKELKLQNIPMLTVYTRSTENNEGFVIDEYKGTEEVPVNYQETKYHIEDDKIILDEVKYWIATHQTTKESLEVKKGFTQLFKNDKWEYVEDHRGEKSYEKSTGMFMRINYVGKVKDGYTTITSEYIQYKKWDYANNIWILDESKKDTLISVISDKIKSQTNINMEEAKWIKSTEEQEFEDAEIHMQFVNIENALDFTDTLASKTMEELIELLITDKLNI